MELLSILAKRHEDWLRMATSLKADIPEDTVQEMYLRLHKYVDDPKRICYEHDEPNTFYVYCTIKNIIHNENKAKQKEPELLSTEEIRQQSDNLLHDEPYDHDTDDVLEIIESEVDEWYWYDRDLFRIYFNDGLSIRKLSAATRISSTSIFNTIKNGKTKIKHRLKQEGKL